ncbi:MAG: UDP-N-acetylmuramoylalanyl-D-glutamyl-2,6-diaminopimelate--D-alanyl-D-alanine ligase [Rhodospirillales bacterium]|nr:UDP-N-acetylmuramoylalanyl-D-glutamyl-2,6-diaminopimelate--D-alanyl-D-alanine ligase [Rhodospirillales bacterium]
MTALPLWTSEEAAAATQGWVNRPWIAQGVSIDSRSLATGDLFVALKGERVDGHDYLNAAAAAGAAALMVSRTDSLPERVSYLAVADTLKGLADLANQARARSPAKVIAVTGSVGKTGTKEMLRLALAANGPTHATLGNLNNQIGLPLTLARLPAEAAYAVLEMGMNHAGELAPLSRLARPDVAIVTAIEMAHVEFFASLDAIADAKAEIFAGLAPGGTAILNRDSPQFSRLAKAARAQGAARIVGFGAHAEAEARLLDCALDPEATTVLALIAERPVTYRLNVPGRHWALNSLAVLAAAQAVGADLERAAQGLAALAPPKGRGQRHRLEREGGTLTLIDESYNASPASMRAALAALALAKPGPEGRRIAVLGDMLELGERGPALHGELAQSIAENRIDLVFTAGPLMENLHRGLARAQQGGHAANADAAAGLVAAALRPGDVVMVKGSAGSRMGRVVEALLHPEGAPARAANGH